MKKVKKTGREVMCLLTQGALRMLGALLILFVTLVIYKICLGLPLNTNGFALIAGQSTTDRAPLTADELNMITSLVKGGQVMPIADVLSTVSGFYGTVITVLIALLTLLGIVSYLYLSFLSRQQAHQFASEAVNNIIKETTYMEKLISEHPQFKDKMTLIRTELDSLIGEYEDRDAMKRDILNLKSTVTALANIINPKKKAKRG